MAVPFIFVQSPMGNEYPLEMRVGLAVKIGDEMLTVVSVDIDNKLVKMRGPHDQQPRVFSPGGSAAEPSTERMFWGNPRDPWRP
jgi:hypothetical protein